MVLSIKQEKLSVAELKSHFELSKDDFAPRSPQYISDYIEKLASNASFITIRDVNGLLYGLTAFYANNLPNAFISRVWLSNCLRGGGIAVKCYNMQRRVA